MSLCASIARLPRVWSCPRGGDRWGKAICLFNFGLCCETGQGVAPSDEEAFRLYRASASLGFPRAMTRLGLCYA